MYSKPIFTRKNYLDFINIMFIENVSGDTNSSMIVNLGVNII